MRVRTNQDTIVARATPEGRGAVALIRLSGPRAKAIVLSSMDWPEDGVAPRRPRLGTFHDGRGAKLDQVLVTWFPGPHSYTGEDVVEISCHGSPFICRAILEACLICGARPAEPGEFTKRSFLAGKLDLLQAEAVQDLVASQTKFQAALAHEQLEGRLSKALEPFRETLIDILAQLETRLEFVEDDVDPESREELTEQIRVVEAGLSRLGRDYEAARTVREGAKVVLAGRPNSGKSSIFNRLVRDERAIVTSVPGTTRDSLREWLDLSGLAVCLIDTAGLRESEDLVEAEGVKRSRRHLDESDLVLFVVDAEVGFGAEDEGLLEYFRESPFILTINKIDTAEAPPIPGNVLGMAREVLEISAKTGMGLPDLTGGRPIGAVGKRSSGEGDPDDHESAANEMYRRGDGCIAGCRKSTGEGSE